MEGRVEDVALPQVGTAPVDMVTLQPALQDYFENYETRMLHGPRAPLSMASMGGAAVASGRNR